MCWFQIKKEHVGTSKRCSDNLANLRINFFGLLFISLNIYTETVEIEEPTKDTAMSMEESLLLPKKRSELEGRERLVLTRDVFTQEAKKLAYIAGPMVVTITSLYLLLVISNMMVGHLGELALSSAAISISFCNVTGMSLLVSCFCCFYLFYTSFFFSSF